MFIVAKHSFKFRFPDGTSYRIPKDYIGDVPDRVAGHAMFKAAIESGMIACPNSHADKEIIKASDKAVQKAVEADIRPDAVGSTPVAVKPVKRASKRVKTENN